MSCNDARIPDPPATTPQPPPPTSMSQHILSVLLTLSPSLPLSCVNSFTWAFGSTRKTHTHTQAHAHTLQSRLEQVATVMVVNIPLSALFYSHRMRFNLKETEVDWLISELINQSDDFRRSDTIGIDWCPHSWGWLKENKQVDLMSASVFRKMPNVECTIMLSLSILFIKVIPYSLVDF